MQHRPFLSPAPARAPLGIILALAIVLLVPIVGIMVWFWTQWAVLQATHPIVADTIRNAVFLLPITLVCWAAGTGIAIWWRRHGWRESIFADKQAELMRATKQVAPMATSFTYSPRSEETNEAALPMLAPPAPAMATPSFASLLDSGAIGAGRPLLLGYSDDGPVEGSWLDLYSTAVAGLPGTGKTTSQRFFACQTALHGAKFAIIDPHAGAMGDSLAATLAPLSSAFLCPPASTSADILNTARMVADIGERRIQGVDKDKTPIILWVDEATALLGRSDIGDELATLMERICQEYRKRAIYISASAQIWTASRTTSELRDSFASVLCHRMKRGQARMLLPTDEAGAVERLPTGSAILWRTSGATAQVTIPNTTERDCIHVGQRLGNTTTAPTTRLPLGFHPATQTAPPVAYGLPNGSQVEATVNLATSPHQSGKTASAEAQRVAQLFFGGKSPAQIVLELRGIKSDAGRAYQAALAEILNLLREGARP